MNADTFRYIFDYNFTENRTLWEKHILPLSQAQFIADVDYSVGSVRHQVVHMMDVEHAWFSDLRGEAFAGMSTPEMLSDRHEIRAEWDTVEDKMRAYLNQLTDDMLMTQPLQNDEDKDLYVWQALLQVANHGTDHRAQLLRILHDLGAHTIGQDFIFYAYDNPFT